MARLLKQIKESQQGQALIIVLALLALGGPLIVATISHAATSVNSVRTIERSVKALYAAEAGVKYGLLHLELEPGPHQLTEKVNQMEVTVEVEKRDFRILYSGELIQGREQSNWVSVDSKIVWDEEVTAYKYTISVGWQAKPGHPVIYLGEVGGRLPVGYSYRAESAALFDDNLSKNDEELEVVTVGEADMLNWKLQSPPPSVSEGNPVHQTFYITGEGDIEDYYAWVVAGLTGTVSEISGTLYIITATAICPESEELTGKIVCEVLEHEDGTKNIISWQVK